MIEINLLPGAAKRSTRRSPRLSFSFAGKFPGLDRWAAFIAVAWIAGPLTIAWLFLTAGRRIETLNVTLEQAVRDSTRYATLIQAQERLRARRDSIAQKLQIIQEVDAGRYTWPHILDEISRALPDYTWLRAIRATDSGDPAATEFQITGLTGNAFALTRFMNDLEQSPFIRGVELGTTEQVRDSQGRLVHQFILTARYEEPPPELIETVPLFEERE